LCKLEIVNRASDLRCQNAVDACSPQQSLLLPLMLSQSADAGQV
jgi:hypothetical protein